MPHYRTAQEIVDQTEAEIAELQRINTEAGFCLLHGLYEDEAKDSGKSFNVGAIFGLMIHANDKRRADVQYYRSNFNIH